MYGNRYRRQQEVDLSRNTDSYAPEHTLFGRRACPNQCARTWRPPLPPPAGCPDAAEAARRVTRAGRAAIRRQNPSSLRAWHGRSLPRCGELTFRTPTRHRAPESGTWKDPDPRRRSSRGSGGSEKACLPGNGGYATPAACPVSTTSWRYGLRRTCRLVTGRSHRPRSTWPNQARLALLAVTHRYKRTHCLWLEQFQIADSARLTSAIGRRATARRLSGSGRRRPERRPTGWGRNSRRGWTGSTGRQCSGGRSGLRCR